MDALTDLWNFNSEVVVVLGIILLAVAFALTGTIISRRIGKTRATKTQQPKPITIVQLTTNIPTVRYIGPTATPWQPSRPQPYPILVRPLGKPMRRAGVVVNGNDEDVIAYTDDLGGTGDYLDEPVTAELLAIPVPTTDEPVTADDDERITGEFAAVPDPLPEPAHADIPDVSPPDVHMDDYGTGRSGDDHTNRGSDCSSDCSRDCDCSHDCSHDCSRDCSSDCSSGGGD